jgi:hypothetical protein
MREMERATTSEQTLAGRILTRIPQQPHPKKKQGEEKKNKSRKRRLSVKEESNGRKPCEKV